MFLTTHAVVAASIFQHFPALPSVLVFLFGFVSHFVLDFIPHGDESLVNDKWSTARKLRRMFFIGWLDLLMVVIFAYWYVERSQVVNYNVLLGIFAAILPDSLQMIYQFLVWRGFSLSWVLHRLQFYHTYLHHFIEHRFGFILTLWQGLVLQLGIIILIFYFYFLN